MNTSMVYLLDEVHYYYIFLNFFFLIILLFCNSLFNVQTTLGETFNRFVNTK